MLKDQPEFAQALARNPLARKIVLGASCGILLGAGVALSYHSARLEKEGRFVAHCEDRFKAQHVGATDVIFHALSLSHQTNVVTTHDDLILNGTVSFMSSPGKTANEPLYCVEGQL